MTEKQKKQKRTYYQQNKEKISKDHAARQKKKYENDPTFRKKCIDTSKKYYRKHRKRLLKYLTEYQRNRTKQRKFLKLSENANDSYGNREKIFAFDLYKIAKRQKLLCALTNEKLTVENCSVDHIIPKSKGGRNIVSNIRLVTLNVNRAKGNQLDGEFFDMCRNVLRTESEKIKSPLSYKKFTFCVHRVKYHSRQNTRRIWMKLKLIT